MFAFGHTWLSFFFLMIGFVNVYRPIKLARNDELPTALTGLTSSAFRRTWRFMLPPTLATIIGWAVTQVGWYDLAKSRTDNYWLSSTTADKSPDLYSAVHGLLAEIYLMWTRNENIWESFSVYILLLVTLRCTPIWRMLILFGGYVFNWFWDEGISA